LFHSINKSLNLQLVLLLLLAGWAGWTVFTQMTVMPPDGNMLLFQYITNLWTWNKVVVSIAVMLLVLTMTVGAIQHYHKNHFAEGRTYMPGVFLLLLLNSGNYLKTLTPSLLTVFFISLILMLYEPNEQAAKMKNRIFTFGLIISIATLLDINASGIALFLFLLISINNVTSFKDIVILFCGLALPYMWAFAVAFFCNGEPVFTQSWRDLSLFVPVKTFTTLRIIDYVTLAVFLVVTIWLMFRDKRLLDNKLIVIRQAFNNVNMLLISMLLSLWLGIMPLPYALFYLLPSLAVYMSLAVSKKRYWPFVDILILALCVMIWL
jgi:hypothetical protein